MKEHVVTSPQSARISTQEHKSLINFSSCDYLGYCDDPRLAKRASEIAEEYGVGLSSVRFICGTTRHHVELEQGISRFFEKDDAILFANGYSANMAVFETFFTKEDAIILDKRVHESLKESADLTRAPRYYFRHNDMRELEAQLEAADKAKTRYKVIAVDGLSASTGEVSSISQICDLADKYDALVLVDECHSFGVLGERGRGAAELEKSLNRVDLISGTFSKAVGGCNGGFLTGNKDVIDLLRQKGRPYLFSNTIPQFTAGTYAYVLDLIQQEPERRRSLSINTRLAREKLAGMGVKIAGHADSPLIPMLIGDEKLAQRVSEELVDSGIMATPWMHPYTAKGEASIRIQVSAKHTEAELSECLGVVQRTFKARGLIE